MAHSDRVHFRVAAWHGAQSGEIARICSTNAKVAGLHDSPFIEKGRGCTPGPFRFLRLVVLEHDRQGYQRDQYRG